MRNKLLITVALAAATFALAVTERDARACGGCFHPPEESPTIVTDHRMILSVSKDQSTLYDQVKYQGSPSAFAWVLPISGTVDVGLSADILFGALDQNTRTTVISPPQNCPPPPNCGTSFGGANSPSANQDASAGGGDVTVTKQEVVGPYLTVQLKATDANALQTWLTDNGFAVTPDVKPVVDKYVAEHFDFLAMKLIPGKGVQDMRPVRVTTKGANAVLPLRMVAAGAGATVGITLWVVSEGRYEAQNFPNFTITADELIWDWTVQKSNYTTLRADKTLASGGRAWETENSTIVYPQQLSQTVTNGGGGFIPPGGPPDPDAGPLTPDEQRARFNYDPVRDAQGNITKTAVQVRDEDLATLFYGIPTSTSRLTRMRADLTKAALDADLVIVASADQSELGTVRQVTKEANQPQCTIYNGCEAVGTAPRDEATARANGNGGESFSCALSSSSASPIWLGAGLGYVAIAIVRARRRRSK
jgi:Uncharacterized protein conserved in bacteria (DUF2330)